MEKVHEKGRVKVNETVLAHLGSRNSYRLSICSYACLFSVHSLAHCMSRRIVDPSENKNSMWIPLCIYGIGFKDDISFFRTWLTPMVIAFIATYIQMVFLCDTHHMIMQLKYYHFHKKKWGNDPELCPNRSWRAALQSGITTQGVSCEVRFVLVVKGHTQALLDHSLVDITNTLLWYLTMHGQALELWYLVVSYKVTNKIVLYLLWNHIGDTNGNFLYKDLAVMLEINLHDHSCKNRSPCCTILQINVYQCFCLFAWSVYSIPQLICFSLVK